MLGMTEGDEAKTARHIEDPDPIGKRRPYKASTPFDQIRSLLGSLLGTDTGKGAGRPPHASLRKGGYLLPRDAYGTSLLAKVESDPRRPGIHEQRLASDISLKTRDKMKDVAVKDDERQPTETNTRQCRTPTRPSDLEQLP